MGSERDRRQQAVLVWAVDTFGSVAVQPRERALRFLEEALELVQAAGLTADDADMLRARVFGSSPGDLRTEMGGAGLTLLALAEVLGLSADATEIDEFVRVKAIDREKFRARQNEKAALGIAGECGEVGAASA